MRPRPWSAYLLRALCCAMLGATGFALLAGSTFALRLREDVPTFVPWLDGPQAIALFVSLALSFAPLLAGKRFLGVFVVSAFLLSGLGAYWWTTIPWDEVITDSGFPSTEPPRMLDYALVASPAVLAAFYATVSRASYVKADLKARGASPTQATRAACASFLAGSALLILCGALAGALWALMASGVVFDAADHGLTGVPAILVAAALATVAYALISRRLPKIPLRRTRAGPKLHASRRKGVLARLRAERAPG